MEPDRVIKTIKELKRMRIVAEGMIKRYRERSTQENLNDEDKAMLKTWEGDFQTFDYTLSFLESMKDASIVPKEKEEKETIISGDGKKHLVYNPNAIGFNACRSQVLLGLAGFKQRLPEIIDKGIGGFTPLYVIEDLVEAILSEIGLDKLPEKE